MQSDAPLEASPLAQLPVALLCAVLALLPADARARCAAVCRAWRTAVANPAVWTQLDLTRAGGLTCRNFRLSHVLRALAPRLAQLRVQQLGLHIGECGTDQESWAALRGVESLVHLGHTPRLRKLRFSDDLYIIPDDRGDVDECVKPLRALLAAGLTLELEHLICDTASGFEFLCLPGLRVRRLF